MQPDKAVKADISARYYTDNADLLSVKYERVTFEEIHPDLVRVLDDRTGNALDIGAGSGRDAAWLSKHGWSVTAVEPSMALLCRAKRRHSDVQIRWVRDSLPNLSAIHPIAGPFDLILLSAVWMHIDPKQETIAISRLKRLLSHSGLLSLSIKTGDVDENRGFFAIDLDALVVNFKSGGFSLMNQTRDTQQRGIEWRRLLLRKTSPTIGRIATD